MGRPAPEKKIDIANILRHKVHTGVCGVFIRAGSVAAPTNAGGALTDNSSGRTEMYLALTINRCSFMNGGKALRTKTTEISTAETGKAALTEIASSSHHLPFYAFPSNMSGIHSRNGAKNDLRQTNRL